MKKLILILTLACLVAIPCHAAGVFYFLKIPSIPGESVEAKHPGEIEAVEFQHSIDRPANGLPSATLSVTKSIDRTSPAIAKAAAMGTVFPHLTLTVFKSVDKPYDFYVIALENATIVSFDQAARGSSLIETIVFTGAKITYTYFPQKADGSIDDGIVETAAVGRR